ncbi:MAG: DUF1302 family protein, partial [Solirubrobacterales bacterium]
MTSGRRASVNQSGPPVPAFVVLALTLASTGRERGAQAGERMPEGLPAPSVEQQTAEVPAARVTVSGYSRGGVFVGKVPGTRLGEMKAAYGELSMAVRTVRETYGEGFAEGRLRYGLQGSQQHTVVDLREAFATLYGGRWFDLRLGKQIIVWGRADALNPTNNLMPFDIRVRSPIEDDRRVGNVAARANLHLGPFRVEGVWIPLYIASELPDIPLPKYVYFGPPINRQPELRDALLAARVHLELPAFEISASYLRGFAPLPGLQRRSVVLEPNTPEILITRTTDYQQVLGFDFSTALGSLLALRGEAAYRLPTDYQHRRYAARPDLQYALGADHVFGPVSVIGQYLGRYVLDWHREEGAPDADPNSLNMVPSATAQKFAEETIDAELAKKNQMLFGQTARIQHLVTARIEWLAA